MDKRMRSLAVDPLGVGAAVPGRAMVWACAWVALGALATGPASAVEEHLAHTLHPAVEAAWHEPDPVAAHEDWGGRLRLRPDSGVHSVQFQVCIVGELCFYQPQDATRLDATTWGFSSATMLGTPGDFGHGWRIGVRWYLATNSSTDPVPEGVPLDTPECLEDPLPCAETHYLAFNIAPGQDRGSPSLALPVALAALVAAAGLVAASSRR